MQALTIYVVRPLSAASGNNIAGEINYVISKEFINCLVITNYYITMQITLLFHYFMLLLYFIHISDTLLYSLLNLIILMCPSNYTK